MKCPKCNYISFDYLRECKKCGEILDGSRRALNLKMGEPTLFTNLNIHETEQNSDNKVETEFTTILSEPDDEQHSVQDTLIDHGLPPTKFEPTIEIDSHRESSLELGGLGSMDTIQQRPEFKVDDSTAKIELDMNEIGDIDDLELSSPFTEKPNLQEADIKIGDLEEIDIDNLDLFAKTENSEFKSADLAKDDIPFEFSLNDSETDLNSDISDTKSGDTLNSVSDDGTIELELDMDDDGESLDDLLAGLISKK